MIQIAHAASAEDASASNPTFGVVKSGKGRGEREISTRES